MGCSACKQTIFTALSRDSGAQQREGHAAPASVTHLLRTGDAVDGCMELFPSLLWVRLCSDAGLSCDGITAAALPLTGEAYALLVAGEKIEGAGSAFL